MENEKILKEAKNIAKEMVESKDFATRKLNIDNLSFKVCLWDGTEQISFFEPFKVEDYFFCLVSE